MACGVALDANIKLNTGDCRICEPVSDVCNLWARLHEQDYLCVVTFFESFRESTISIHFYGI